MVSFGMFEWKGTGSQQLGTHLSRFYDSIKKLSFTRYCFDFSTFLGFTSKMVKNERGYVEKFSSKSVLNHLKLIQKLKEKLNFRYSVFPTYFLSNSLAHTQFSQFSGPPFKLTGLLQTLKKFQSQKVEVNQTNPVRLVNSI